MVRYLLEHKADVNIDCDLGSSGTALAYSAEKFEDGQNWVDIVLLLLADERHEIENLVVSGVGAKGRSDEAACMIWKEAKRRGFDYEDATAMPKGVTEFHLKRYKKWYADEYLGGSVTLAVAELWVAPPSNVPGPIDLHQDLSINGEVLRPDHPLAKLQTQPPGEPREKEGGKAIDPTEAVPANNNQEPAPTEEFPISPPPAQERTQEERIIQLEAKASQRAAVEEAAAVAEPAAVVEEMPPEAPSPAEEGLSAP